MITLGIMPPQLMQITMKHSEISNLMNLQILKIHIAEYGDRLMRLSKNYHH